MVASLKIETKMVIILGRPSSSKLKQKFHFKMLLNIHNFNIAILL